MGYNAALFDLLKWDRQEFFFRDYYCRNDVERAALLARPNADPDWKRYAQDVHSINANETEERFFASGRNVSLVRHPRYFPFFLHRHAFFEMLYVATGGCTQVINGHEMRLERGDLCLLAPDVEHGIKVFDDSMVLNILIRSSTFLDIFLNAVRDKSHISEFFLGSMYDRSRLPYLVFHTEGDEVLLQYVLDMYAEQELLDDYSDHIICSLLTIFFSQLTRRHGDTAELPSAVQDLSDEGSALMATIMARYASITLVELAEEFHFSVPYCSKLIKRFCGLPFSELIARIRLQQAETLLKTTQLRVEDVGEAVGYKNPETLIRAFRRAYGKTPSQYRREA